MSPSQRLLLVALAALVLAGGCNTGIAENEAERRLRRALPEIIGPAANYNVKVRASSDFSVIGGRLRNITIEGSKVRLGNRWPVDDLTVVLEKVRVDMERQTLDSVGSARFEVAIRSGTLARYLDGDEDNLKDVAVLLDEGQLTLVGRYKVLGVWASFRVAGNLVLMDNRRIGFRPGKASAVGIPVPGPVVRYLERRLNPVLDVSDALLPIDLTEVRIQPPNVIVAGTPQLEDTTVLNR